jgi:hypothetical protein
MKNVFYAIGLVVAGVVMFFTGFSCQTPKASSQAYHAPQAPPVMADGWDCTCSPTCQCLHGDCGSVNCPTHHSHRSDPAPKKKCDCVNPSDCTCDKDSCNCPNCNRPIANPPVTKKHCYCSDPSNCTCDKGSCECAACNPSAKKEPKKVMDERGDKPSDDAVWDDEVGLWKRVYEGKTVWWNPLRRVWWYQKASIETSPTYQSVANYQSFPQQQYYAPMQYSSVSCSSRGG